MVKVVFPDETLGEASPAIIKYGRVAVWVPILFGFITPIFFTTNGMLQKHLSSKRVGFDPSLVASNSITVTSIVVVCIALPYWVNVEFESRIFWIGFIGSIIDTIGKVVSQTAFSYGPTGPCCALQAMGGVYLVIITAAKQGVMLNYLEILACIFCLLGAFELVIHEKVEYILFLKFLRPNKKSDESKPLAFTPINKENPYQNKNKN